MARASGGPDSALVLPCGVKVKSCRLNQNEQSEGGVLVESRGLWPEDPREV